jgi:hypothetical protein
VVLLWTRSFRARANAKAPPFSHAAGGAFSHSRSKAIKGINCPGRGAHHSRLDCGIAPPVVRVSVGQATKARRSESPFVPGESSDSHLPLSARDGQGEERTPARSAIVGPTAHLAFGSPLCQKIPWCPVHRLAAEPLLGVVPQPSSPIAYLSVSAKPDLSYQKHDGPSPRRETWQGAHGY